MRTIDLTHPFSASVYNPPGFPEVRIEELDPDPTASLRDTLVSFVVHVATHIDAPMHLRERTRDIASIPLDALIGSGVAWKIPCDEPRAIDAEDLEMARPSPRRGDHVFIWTGWDRHFCNFERYARHPYLTEAAARWLVERRIGLFGIDTPTPDLAVPFRDPGFEYPVHRELLSHDIPIVENVASLSEVAGRRFEAFVCPVPFVDADGAPARVFARVRDEGAEGA